MKNKRILVKCALLTISLVLASGCAIGAATAAYAMNARSAESLTAEAEERIIAKVKEEVRAELKKQ